MESGNVTISGTEDDGIQVSFKDDTNREAEDTGTFTMKGGKINVTVSATAAKAIKADGDFVVTGGEIIAMASGAGSWDSTAKKTKASSCISVDGKASISGGTFNLTATSGGGKGISVDGSLNISGGTFDISTTGGMLAYVNGTIYQSYTGNSAPSSSASTQAYLILSQSVTAGTTVSVSDGTTTLVSFEIPEAYGNTSMSSHGPGGWDWGWGGGGPGGGGQWRIPNKLSGNGQR